MMDLMTKIKRSDLTSKRMHIVNVHVGMLKALARRKVKVSGNLIELKMPMHIAALICLLFDLVNKTLLNALKPEVSAKKHSEKM
jgi:hypothetical protein